MEIIKKIINWIYVEIILYEWNALKSLINWILGRKGEVKAVIAQPISSNLKPPTITDLAIQKIDETLAFSVDTATIAFFDPQTLAHRASDEDWWISFDDEDLPEIVQGKTALFSTGIDGFYTMRLSSSPELTPLEKKYCVQVIERAGVEVTSGLLVIGDAATLPGYGGDLELPKHDWGNGNYYRIQPGKYDLTIYCLDLMPDEETAEVKELTDFVVYLKPRTQQDFTFKGELRMDLLSGNYIYR